MKYLVYLITLLFSTAVAQNPTILQGNYVSNVFGQANFVLNPNAQTSVSNVNVTNATATRSTTTPLVATTEFNVTVTSANGTAAWATRSFDAGMKNQNCEARFSYRGFQATSKAQIKQGANVIAELTLTPSATDPRIASINFPCGDLSSATTFVITDSATLSGTNEIGGIYVGLATNQANVAQAEVVVSARYNGGGGYAQTIPSGSTTRIIWNVENTDVLGEYDTSTGIFTAKRSGQYKIETMLFWQSASYPVGSVIEIQLLKNGGSGGSNQWRNRYTFQATQTFFPQNMLVAQVNLNVGDTLELVATQSTGTDKQIYTGGQEWSQFTITRFPSSSELVVTPETQNVWGGVVYTNQYQTIHNAVAEPTGWTSYNNATWNQPTLLKGKAAVTTTNSGNDLGFSIPNLPVGQYKLSITGLISTNTTGGTYALGNQGSCSFRVRETTLNDVVATQAHSDAVYGASSNYETRDFINSFQGIFTNNSLGTRNFILEANKLVDSSSGNTFGCQVFSSNSGNYYTYISFIIEPLDNASNSALYVQGPVKGSGTGTAIPAGYVGEVNQSTLSIISTSTTGWQMIKSISLTPGVWLCSGGVHFSKGAATYSAANLVASFHYDGTTNPGTGIPYDTNPGRLVISPTYMPNALGLGINPAVIAVDGSNIYTPWGSGAGNTLYIWFYAGSFSGTINTGSSHTCTRLN